MVRHQPDSSSRIALAPVPRWRATRASPSASAGTKPCRMTAANSARLWSRVPDRACPWKRLYSSAPRLPGPRGGIALDEQVERMVDQHVLADQCGQCVGPVRASGCRRCRVRAWVYGLRHRAAHRCDRQHTFLTGCSVIGGLASRLPCRRRDDAAPCTGACCMASSGRAIARHGSANDLPSVQ